MPPIMLLVGFVFILAGLILRFFPPKKINWYYGYRTFQSMKSQEHWDFAQIYSGKQLTIWGVITTVLNVTIYFVDYGQSLQFDTLFAVTVILIAVLMVFITTEWRMKRRFGK